MKVLPKKHHTKPNIRTGGKIFEWKIFVFLRYVLTGAVALFLKLWWSTLRIKISNESFHILKKTPSPLISIFWHNHLFFAGYCGKFRPKGRLYALISAGAIGAWISPIFERFNAKPIRGSSNLRGKQALKEVVQVVMDGNDIIITPDGSRGPCYDFKPGTALVVKMANPAILFFSCNFHNSWRLKTWDRFYIPKPFSTVECTVKLFSSYRDLTNSDDIQDITDALKSQLMAITHDPLKIS
jgi:lysophospholipid acyltransferase (LPLAT)-like uncharacterized protein